MKTVAVILFFLLAAGCANGQPAPGNKQNLIRSLFPEKMEFNFLLKALDSSVCIVRQDYNLANAVGDEFGANGKSYWDMKLTVGVIAGGNLYTSPTILTPWKNDNDLEEFLKKDTQHLSPHLSNRYFRRMADSSFTVLKSNPSGYRLADTIVTAPEPVKSKKNKKGKPAATDKKQGMDSSYAHRQPAGDSIPVTFPLAGLISTMPKSGNAADTTGWLVLVSGKSPGEAKDTTGLSFQVLKPVLANRATSSRKYIVNLPVKENVIGGVYYTVTYSMGKMLFSAAGLLSGNETGWFISPLPQGGSGQAETIP